MHFDEIIVVRSRLARSSEPKWYKFVRAVVEDAADCDGNVDAAITQAQVSEQVRQAIQASLVVFVSVRFWLAGYRLC